MIENKICCYINGFVKWKISYIVGNKKLSGKICFFDLRNKRKSVFARVTISAKDESTSQRKRARLQLKIPIDEKLG